MLKSVNISKKYITILIVLFIFVASISLLFVVERKSKDNNAENSLKTVTRSFDEINKDKQVQGIEDIEISQDIQSTPQKVTDEQIKPKESSSTAAQKSVSAPKTINPAPVPKPSPVNGTCPISTKSCVPCSIGQSLCRYETGATAGFLGWSCQNNNPGNIRYSNARIGYITKHGGPAPCGERFDSRGGTYMIFSTYQDGRNALRAYLLALDAGTHTSYSECTNGTCDLSYVFKLYAPGDTNYAQNVADRLGISVTTTFRWVVQNKLDQLINAIEIKEGFFSN